STFFWRETDVPGALASFFLVALLLGAAWWLPSRHGYFVLAVIVLVLLGFAVAYAHLWARLDLGRFGPRARNAVWCCATYGLIPSVRVAASGFPILLLVVVVGMVGRGIFFQSAGDALVS